MIDNVRDVSDLIAAGSSILVVIGGLWGRVETINRQTKKELRKCTEREALSRESRSMLLTAFEFVIAALHRHDPKATEIAHSRQLIEELKAKDRYEANRDDLT